MRPLGILATLLSCGLVLAGCGDESGAVDRPEASASASATPPAPEGESGSAPADATGGAGASQEVAILSQPAAGGEVSTIGVELGDAAAVQEFTAQFSNAQLRDRVARAVETTDVPAGSTLYGAVISVGCNEPPGTLVSATDTGVIITGAKITVARQECLVAVTSVALVLVTDG